MITLLPTNKTNGILEQRMFFAEKNMRHIKGLASIVALGILGYAPLSVAAPITFDFSEYRSYSASGHQYVGSDGVSTVDVSPYAEYGTPYLASSSSAGLYIYTCTDHDRGCRNDDNTHQIDGWGANEAAVLDFGSMVNLISATFSYIGSNDDFTLLVGGADGSVVLDDQDPGSNFMSTYTFGSDVTGSEFAFLADHWSDDFTLYSVTAEYVSNVPEPASLSLLGLGLLALGSVSRKK